MAADWPSGERVAPARILTCSRRSDIGAGPHSRPPEPASVRRLALPRTEALPRRSRPPPMLQWQSELLLAFYSLHPERHRHLFISEPLEVFRDLGVLVGSKRHSMARPGVLYRFLNGSQNVESRDLMTRRYPRPLDMRKADDARTRHYPAVFILHPLEQGVGGQSDSIGLSEFLGSKGYYHLMHHRQKVRVRRSCPEKLPRLEPSGPRCRVAHVNRKAGNRNCRLNPVHKLSEELRPWPRYSPVLVEELRLQQRRCQRSGLHPIFPS